MDMQITFPGGARVEARYRGFSIQTDQPTRSGGEGAFPAPFDYFLASIGTCAGLYVRSFLERRGIPGDGARLTLHGEKDPAKGRLAEITLTVHLPPGFPEKYRAAVAHVVDLCPVKQHILDPPRFLTRVRIGGEEDAEPGSDAPTGEERHAAT